MINFRFHLVSLVAVFLALTIGIVVGASVVNQQIVDGLNRRINTVENNADKQRSENQILSGQVKELDSYLEDVAPFAVENRLTSVPVVVVAEQGVDRDRVRALVTLLQDAGAHTPAIVWLESKWTLEKADDRAALAAVIGVDATTSGLRDQALNQLAERVGTAVASPSSSAAATTTTTAKSTTPADVLAALTAAGFVSVEAVGESGTTDLSTFPQAGARVVLVSGEATDLPAQVFPSLAKGLSALETPTVAAEIYTSTNGQPPRGTIVKPIRDDRELSASITTADHLDLVQGEIAVVLATADLGEGKVGSYGYGSGADAPLPAWSGS